MSDIPRLNTETFIQEVKSGSCWLIDARSPGEYDVGHIPGASSFPLLNNEERHIVGLTYKTQGHVAAVQKGFELVGGKFAQYVSDARKIADDRPVYVYCWRGGLRSQIMAWVLNLGGLKVRLLEGGYKSYRSHALRLFQLPRHIVVLAGKTGCGKTAVLHALKDRGEQIIDLEALANHKGSSFGALGKEAQHTQEQFENDLCDALTALDPDKPVWVEDESRFIGKLRIPDPFFDAMMMAPAVEMVCPRAIRVSRILREYGHFDTELLRERTAALSKRMGGEQNKQALEYLDTGDKASWVHALLDYYDKMYDHAFLTSRLRVRTVVPPDIYCQQVEIAEDNTLLALDMIYEACPSNFFIT